MLKFSMDRVCVEMNVVLKFNMDWVCVEMNVLLRFNMDGYVLRWM